MYKINTSVQSSNYILTNHGHKDPYDVIYNDRICDHLGTFQIINNIIHSSNNENKGDKENKGDEENKKINTYQKKYAIHTNYTLDIICPFNQIFLTKYIDMHLPLSDKFDLLHSENYSWTTSESLKKGHLLAVPINKHQEKPSISVMRNNTLYQYKLNSSRIWFLLGYYLHYGIIEDSSIYTNCIQLTIYDKKERHLLSFLDSFIVSIPTIFSNGLNEFCTYRIVLDDISFQIISNLIDKKTIPEWIQDASRFYLYSFIHGFLYNIKGLESNYTPNSVMYTWNIISDTLHLCKIDIELLLSFQRILFKCDIVNTISTNKKRKNIAYEMTIYKEKNKEDELYPFFSNNIVWIPFVEKEAIDNTECITHIQNDQNTFIMNNIVMKNSVCFS